MSALIECSHLQKPQLRLFDILSTLLTQYLCQSITVKITHCQGAHIVSCHLWVSQMGQKNKV